MPARKDTKHHIALIALIILFAVIFMVVKSGAFRRDPVVEITADNCYTKTLHVITDEDYRPYSFYDAEGRYSGHDVELIAMIANDLGMNLDLQFMPWDDGIKAMDQGKADILMTCDYSDTFAGTDVLTKSEPISDDEFIVYSKTPIRSVDELYGKTIGVMKNGNVTAQVEMLNLTGRCSYYMNNREAMRALMNDRIDCVIMRNSVGTVLLSELGAKDIKGYVSIGLSYMCFGMNADKSELGDRINESIERIKLDGRLEKLNEKWLTTFVRPYTFAEVIANNIAVFLVLVALLCVSVILLFLNNAANMRRREEEYRNAQVVDNLAKDFDCVNYVRLGEDRDHDTAINYRISDILKENIPGWEEEKSFAKKLEMIGEFVPDGPERERFEEESGRERIIEELQKEDTCFVNLRIILDGEPKYYQMKNTALRENGQLVGFVSGFHSVDEQIKNEMELEAKLEAANKSKTDFLFNMSHDIRTPMNAIIGFTDIAKKNADDRARVDDCLNKIESSGNHLLKLINEVLDMSRVEAGRLRSDMKVVNISEEAEKLISICRETANKKNVSLELIDSGIKKPVVIADDLHVNRILMNILSNSIKYTLPGGRVVFTLSEEELESPERGKYIFTVRDNGIGMSEEFLGKIFDAFSREETSTASGIEGTGLGMAIVKKLVDFLDGSIEIKSEQGKGTETTISFVFERALGEAPERKNTEKRRADLRGRKALLVEDNELNREIATELLQEKGIAVEEAVNGLEAVNAVRGKGTAYYDFILMDIQMPFMDGYEATREIRRLKGAEKLVIIAISANAFEEDRKKSLEAGMNAHLAKPINAEHLAETLAEFA